MAIATTTALAAAGLALSAGSTAMSFTQAAKQNKLKNQAEAAAAEAMAEARKKLEVNFYDQLAIQKEPYELEREALIAAGAQGLQAAQEAEGRGAGATAGRIQMAQTQGQRQIASAMGQEMLGLEKLSAEEESRLRDMAVKLDMGEASGAQLAAREAGAAASAATTQAMQGLTSMGQQVAQMAPLYAKTPSARQAARIDNLASRQLGLSQADMQKSIAGLGTINNVDLSKVAGMSPLQYQDFMGRLDTGTLTQIQQMLPGAAQAFRPAEYALPQMQPQIPSPFQYNFNIPALGGR